MLQELRTPQQLRTDLTGFKSGQRMDKAGQRMDNEKNRITICIHSTNFIFYVLTAERFRNQLKNIFMFWKKDTNAQVKINEVRTLL